MRNRHIFSPTYNPQSARFAWRRIVWRHRNFSSHGIAPVTFKAIFFYYTRLSCIGGLLLYSHLALPSNRNSA